MQDLLFFPFKAEASNGTLETESFWASIEVKKIKFILNPISNMK